MWRKAIPVVRNVVFVQIQPEPVGLLVRKHSNLYSYTENGLTVEFVQVTSAPAVGGFIVVIDQDAPIFLNQAEFARQYVEA